MTRILFVISFAVFATGCEACCNSVEVMDSRVAIALDVAHAVAEGSETLALVLEEHRLTIAEFEDLMAEIAEDPALSLVYTRAVRRADLD